MHDRIHRRDWLAAASAVTATSLLGRRAAVAGEFTGKIKKAVKYHMITGDLSVGDKFKLLQDLGFDGVEPRTSDGKKHLREMVKASQQTGVAIHGVVRPGSVVTGSGKVAVESNGRFRTSATVSPKNPDVRLRIERNGTVKEIVRRFRAR